jgi:hypothetical protein
MPAKLWRSSSKFCLEKNYIIILLYFCKKYLRQFLHRFLRRFLHRFLRSRIAVCVVSSPSHRRIASRRWVDADFIRISSASGAQAADSLHADWRSGATSAGSRRGDDEDTCRSHDRKVVTRWSSISYAQCTVRWGRSWITVTAQHKLQLHNPRKKTQTIKLWYAVLCTIPQE